MLDHWRLLKGIYIVKLKKDNGLDGDNDVKKTLPSQLGAFILSNCKRIMNNFFGEIDGLYSKSNYYGDTDSLYNERRYCDVLYRAKLVGKTLSEGKKDYKSGGIFYGFFLAFKIKYCLTNFKFGIFQQHMTFKSFTDSKRLLYLSHYFYVSEGKKISSILPRSGKKSFKNGNVIPAKMKSCDECKDKTLCMTCNNQVNENKEFEASLFI